MENKETEVTPRDLEDADPSQFQTLVESVWRIFENEMCEEKDAMRMLNSAAKTMFSIGNFKKIEDEFNLGLLGEYVGRNKETLPFLATVMSHIHDQLERELAKTSADTPGTNNEHNNSTMATFLAELKEKLGADDRTKDILQEIAAMADQAAINLANGNPEFTRLLMEIGETMRDSWKSLEDEVEKCIRHARKKNYSKRKMRNIYKRIICKGLSSAKTIQGKIDSVSATLDPIPRVEMTDGNQPDAKQGVYNDIDF